MITRRQLLKLFSGAAAVGLFTGIRLKETLAYATREIDIKGYSNVLLPRGHGQLTKLAKPIRRRYPSRDHSMQLAAFFSDREGLLVYTKDPVGHVSDWEILPGKHLKIIFYGPEPEVVTVPVDATLISVASEYKKWALEQTWAKKARSRGRKFPYSLVAVASNPNMKNQYDNILKLIEKYPHPIAAWITQWRKFSFDHMYPDYTPSNDLDFKIFLSRLKEVKCTAFPYINGLLWDSRNNEFKIGEDVSTRDAKGRHTIYNKELHWLRYACPAAQFWRDIISDVRQSLKDFEGTLSKGVYLDMLLAAQPMLCYASHHDHNPGDSFAWQEGIKKILASSSGEIITEGNAEIYLGDVDAMLMHLYSDEKDIVPLWSLVYGDYVSSVGWIIRANASLNEIDQQLTIAKRFGLACNGSPWMTHEIQERIINQEFAEVFFRQIVKN